MRNLAAELKHSETAFVLPLTDKAYQIRYFTSVGEVELCGHATISLFTVLRECCGIKPGTYLADTLAGPLNIDVRETEVWMDMAAPKSIYEFNEDESRLLYEAFATDFSFDPENLQPQIISTGLRDILLPVRTREQLEQMKIDTDLVNRISKEYDVIGVHAFSLGDGSVTAYCRNYAPLYGIEEEFATGTANGALTFYLKQQGYIQDGQVCTYIQGETMGRKSIIYASIDDCLVRVGGQAVISVIGTSC